MWHFVIALLAALGTSVAANGYRMLDGQRLAVEWNEPQPAAFQRIQVDERADRVTVRVVEHVPGGIVMESFRPRTRTVTLARPLGHRPVIDATTGRRLTPR